MDVFPDLFVRVQGWYSSGPDALVSALAPGVRWADAVGRFEGIAAVTDHLLGTWSADDLRPQELHVLPDGLVVVDVHRTVRDDRGAVGAEVDEQHRVRLTDDGRISEFSVRAGRPRTR